MLSDIGVDCFKWEMTDGVLVPSLIFSVTCFPFPSDNLVIITLKILYWMNVGVEYFNGMTDAKS